jgi:hypothetical protein
MRANTTPYVYLWHVANPEEEARQWEWWVRRQQQQLSGHFHETKLEIERCQILIWRA